MSLEQSYISQCIRVSSEAFGISFGFCSYKNCSVWDNFESHKMSIDMFHELIQSRCTDLKFMDNKKKMKMKKKKKILKLWCLDMAWIQ